MGRGIARVSVEVVVESDHRGVHDGLGCGENRIEPFALSDVSDDHVPLLAKSAIADVRDINEGIEVIGYGRFGDVVGAIGRKHLRRDITVWILPGRGDEGSQIGFDVDGLVPIRVESLVFGQSDWPSDFALACLVIGPGNEFVLSIGRLLGFLDIGSVILGDWGNVGSAVGYEGDRVLLLHLIHDGIISRFRADGWNRDNFSAKRIGPAEYGVVPFLGVLLGIVIGWRGSLFPFFRIQSGSFFVFERNEEFRLRGFNAGGGIGFRRGILARGSLGSARGGVFRSAAAAGEHHGQCDGGEDE